MANTIKVIPEKTFAAFICGAPTAAVLFAGEVDARTRKDPRLQITTLHNIILTEAGLF